MLSRNLDGWEFSDCDSSTHHNKKGRKSADEEVELISVEAKKCKKDANEMINGRSMLELCKSK